MNIRTKGTVKYKGNYLPPGTEMDVEQEVADQLLQMDPPAAEALEALPPPEAVEEPVLDPELNADPDPDPNPDADPAVDIEAATEELCQVEGVDKRSVKVLLDNGITSIASLQGYTEEQLAEFKGISAKGAKTIAADAQQFETGPDEEVDPDADAAADAAADPVE
jgi:helix-hairpin-helix protein